jgi:sugar lactone lactonase YvrE
MRYCTRQSGAQRTAPRAGTPRNLSGVDARYTWHLAWLLLAIAASGCVASAEFSGQFDRIWGEPGLGDGQFQKPRAMAIDEQGEIYVVDMSARIQVFTPDGTFLRGWRTPAWETGKPTGLSIGRDGCLLVADTHYFRVLVYTPQGELLPQRTIGGRQGTGPGEFGFVTDAVQDSQGNYYIAEYGENDRIQKFSPQGAFLLSWGGHGTEPGQFIRPQNLAVDQADRIWVCDACNHRIQVFDPTGRLLRMWGRHGSQPGELSYPYDLTFDADGNVYVVEFGNHRVQKFTPDGRSLGCWGTHGRGPGMLHNPWGLVCDPHGRIHVLDTYNHRVQRIRM